MTRLLTCGWESGYTTAAANIGAEELFAVNSATFGNYNAGVSVVANPAWWKSKGSYVLEIVSGWGSALYATGLPVCTWAGFKWGCSALPTASQQIMGDTAGNYGLFLDNTGVIALATAAGQTTSTAPIKSSSGRIVAQHCYAIDIKSVSGTYELWVQDLTAGTAAVQIGTSASGTGTLNGTLLFNSDNVGSVNYFWDDLYMNNATASNSGQTGRRTTPSSVKALIPAADVGSSPAGFTNSAGLTFGNSSTGWFSAVKLRPFGGLTTSFIGKSTASTVVYEGSFAASLAGEVPVAAALIAWMDGATALSCNANISMKANSVDGTAVVATMLWTVARAYRIDMDVASGTIAWTKTLLDAATAKFGSSTDVSPNPKLLNWLLTYEVPDIQLLASASIAATSTFSGAVSKTSAGKAITPASIAATSTMSSTGVVAGRPISPASIASTSTVAGKEQQLKGIGTGLFSSTSTVSGTVSVRRAIITVTINSTSTAAGIVTRLRPIAPANVLSTSTFTGKIVALRAIKPATVSSTSTFSGSATELHHLIASNILSTSTFAGTIAAIHRVSGAIASTSTFVALVTRLRPILPVNILSTSTTSGSIRALRAIKPSNVLSTSTFSGSLAEQHHLISANILSTSTTSGSVAELHHLVAANISSASTVSGIVVSLRAIKPANVLSTSTFAGALKMLRGIIPANVLSTSTLSGKVVALRKISGNIASTSTFSTLFGPIKHITPANILSTSTASGNVTALRAVRPASVASTSTLSAAVSVRRAVLPANILATSTASGRVVALRRLFPANILSTSTLTAAVIRLRPISGAIASTSVASASIIALRKIAGIINSVSTAAGSLRVNRAIKPSPVNSTSTFSGSTITVRSLHTSNIFSLSTAAATVHRVAGIVPALINSPSSAFAYIGVDRIVHPGVILAYSTLSGSIISTNITLDIGRIQPGVIARGVVGQATSGVTEGRLSGGVAGQMSGGNVTGFISRGHQ